MSTTALCSDYRKSSLRQSLVELLPKSLQFRWIPACHPPRVFSRSTCGSALRDIDRREIGALHLATPEAPRKVDTPRFSQDQDLHPSLGLRKMFLQARGPYCIPYINDGYRSPCFRLHDPFNSKSMATIHSPVHMHIDFSAVAGVQLPLPGLIGPKHDDMTREAPLEP